MTASFELRHPLAVRETGRLLHHGPTLLIGVLLVWMPLSFVLRVFWEVVPLAGSLSPAGYFAFRAVPLVFRPDIPLALVLVGIVLPMREWRIERLELLVTPQTVRQIVLGKIAPPAALLVFLNLICIPVFYPNLLEQVPGIVVRPQAWHGLANVALTALASLEDVLYAMICVLFAAHEALRADDRVFATMRMVGMVTGVGMGIALWGTIVEMLLGGLLLNSLGWTEYLVASNLAFLLPTLTLEALIVRGTWRQVVSAYQLRDAV